MDPARTDAGSFRDPSGRVYVVDGRVFRTVMPSAVEDFEFVRSTGFLERLIADGRETNRHRYGQSLLQMAPRRRFERPACSQREANYYIDYFVPAKFSLPANLEIAPNWNLTSAHITSNLEELADESL